MFGIQNYDKSIFKHNFLRDIVFKVYYKENTLCSSRRNDFVEIFKDDYPIITDGISQEIAFTLDRQQREEQSISIKNNSDAHQIIMRSPSNQKEFVLNNESLQYKESGREYISSQNFNSKIRMAVPFLQEVGVVECRAFSIRKINIIDFLSKNTENNKEVATYEPLRELIAPYLLCSYDNFKSANKYIKQNVYTIQLEERDYLLVIKYGYVISEKNSSTSNIKGQVIIDLSIMKKGSFPIDGMIEELRKCHCELYNAFRWSISQKLLTMISEEQI